MRTTLQACLILSLSLPLAACSDGWWSFGSGKDSRKELEAPLALRPVPVHQSLHIAAPEGAPAALGSHLREELRAAMAARGVLASSVETLESPFRLNTALKAASNASGVIIILVADVEEKGAGRLSRTVVEERLPVSPGADADAWLAVSDALLQRLAGETVKRLAAAPEFASLLDPAAERRRLAARTGLGQGTETPPEMPAAAEPLLITGSTGRTARQETPQGAFTVTVRSAPGDGRSALARAVRQALEAESAARGGYFVTGDVRTEPRGTGRTHVEIDWMVLAPDGTPLGVVKQANEVGTGEIAGEWGTVAEAAGEAAARGIRELLDTEDGPS